jgi:hypothetical protein
MRAAPAVLLAALAAPALGQAPQASLDSGLWFGVRGGYAVPSGDISRGGAAVRDVVEYKLPIWLDLGYRFNRWVWGDLFIELAPAKVADASCPPDVACSASDVRFGLGAQLHLASRAALDPWVGIGVGVQVMNAEVWDPTLLGVTEWSWAGIEFPIVEAGIDVAVSRRLSLGPYAALSFASFTSVSQRPPGGSTTSDSVEERASHSWAQAGLKLTIRL